MTISVSPGLITPRAQHHGVGPHRLVHGGVGDGLAMRVVGTAPDEIGLGVESRRALAVQPGNQAFDFGHDFRPDAVAREKQQIICRHWKLLPRMRHCAPP
jgi:hypothetical protein